MRYSTARIDHLLFTARTRGAGAAARLAGTRLRQRLRALRFRFIYPQVEWGEDVTIRGRLVIRGFGRVVIGDRCHFAARSGETNVIATLRKGATVRIGDDCFLNGAVFVATETIDVGAGCLFGPSTITDSDFHSVQSDRREAGVAGDTAPVSIGRNVWIGAQALVLKGAAIGDDAVVGAGTVVRKDVPAKSIVIGNPQQVVGSVS